MLLDLPDRRQSAGHDCGLACALTAYEYLSVDIPELPDWLPCERQGMSPQVLEAFLRHGGLGTVAGELQDLKELQWHVDRGRPVACLVSLHGGHWVCVRGVSRGRVYLQDPTRGRWDVRADEFAGLWKDVDRMGTQYYQWAVAAWA